MSTLFSALVNIFNPTHTLIYFTWKGRGILCFSGHYSSDQWDTWRCSWGLTEVAHSEWQHRKTPLLIHFPSLFPPLRSPVNLFCEIQQCLSASLTTPPSLEMESLMRARLIFTGLDCDGKEGREKGEDEGDGMQFSQREKWINIETSLKERSPWRLKPVPPNSGFASVFF